MKFINTLNCLVFWKHWINNRHSHFVVRYKNKDSPLELKYRLFIIVWGWLHPPDKKKLMWISGIAHTSRNLIHGKNNTNHKLGNSFTQQLLLPKGVLMFYPRKVWLLAPLTDSILVEAALQPQFPCSKVSRKTG